MLYINEKVKLSTFFYFIVRYKHPPLRERGKDSILLSQYVIDGYLLAGYFEKLGAENMGERIFNS